MGKKNKFMTVKVSYDDREVIYYRQQKSDHPPHSESNPFSTDAIAHFQRTYNITDKPRTSSYRSGNSHTPGNGVKI